MHLRSLVTAILVGVAASALAQSEAFVGRWSGTMQVSEGRELPLEVTINETSGAWKMVLVGPRGRANPCLGRDLPMTVEAKGDSVVLDIRGAEVLAGCLNQRVTLTLTGGQLSGQFPSGSAVKLTKK